jgi:TRAP-type C4-dicarboxylate transport system substrate-binding protein
MTFRILAALVGMAALSGTVVSARAEETIKLTIISGHPLATVGVTKLRDVFVPEVDKQLAAGKKYKIDWTQSYGGTVAKPPAVFEAIESGIGDIGYVPTIFEADKLPLEQLSYVTPFGTGDVTKLVQVMAKLREAMPEMKQAFLKHKQTFLAGVAIDNYHLVTKFPIASVDDLEGKKIATGGLATNWIKNSGAVAISGNLTEYFNGMQTGVYDGIIIFESAIPGYRFHEVAPYVTKVGFGAMSSSALTMNTARLKSLPAEVRDAILKAAHRYETEVAVAYAEAGQKALKKIAGEGAKISDFPPAERKKLASKLPNLAREWAKIVDSKGFPASTAVSKYMEISRSMGIEHVREWDKE